MEPYSTQLFLDSLDKRLNEAVQYYWDQRDVQQQKQISKGQTDQGFRGAATGGGQLRKLELLLLDAAKSTGIDTIQYRIGKSTDTDSSSHLELPGYYRPEKKWDMLILSEERLIAAIEFKSHVGPSFGNNANNRAEEAIGCAKDFWTAFREGRFRTSDPPFLGYFFLLQDCDEVHKGVRPKEPNFPVDPVFKSDGSLTYAKRYEILIERLKLERMYTDACFIMATKSTPTIIKEPSRNLGFRQFIISLISHIHGVHLRNHTER